MTVPSPAGSEPGSPGLLRDWRIVLASASESRLRLLRNAGIEPEVRVSDVDEELIEAQLGDPEPEHLAARLARAKAESVAGQVRSAPTLVIGADSVLDVAGRPMGKPLRPDVALERAGQMRGRSADLITGHCVVALTPAPSGPASRVLEQAVRTTVNFGSPTDAELAAYVATGEPLHVAGGFTLDGLSSPFIDGVIGDPNNVIGLSLVALRRMFAELGIAWVL